MTNWKRSVLIFFFFYLIIFSGFDSNLAFFLLFVFSCFCLLNVLDPLLATLTAPTPLSIPFLLYPSYCASSISSLHVQLILQYHVVLLSSVFLRS